MNKIIIISTPRAGTQRVHSAFGHAKIDSGWEQDGGDVTASLFLSVDADLDDFAFHQRHKPYWDRHVDEIWHQTRDPLYCIPALAAVTPAAIWAWQNRYTGLDPRAFRSRAEFCASFWVAWNEICEQRQPVWQYRVEEFEQHWPEMWKRLDAGEAPPLDDRSVSLDRQTRQPMTYDEIRSWGPTIHDKVRRLAERYGYEVTE